MNCIGRIFSPHDLTVLEKLVRRAVHDEPDMLKRRDLIGLATKLQNSRKRRHRPRRLKVAAA